MELENLLKELRELNLSGDEYAIFASGPMAVRRIREANDLDIIVIKRLYQELKEKYPVKDDRIAIGNIEIIDPDHSVVENPEELINRAENIDGFKYVPLEDIISWKKKMGRPKDLKDIELINNYLKNK